MKRFKMTHKIWEEAEPIFFDETNAPFWLTGEKTVPGSTMDGRWFWNENVLKMVVGQTIETDFRSITRIE